MNNCERIMPSFYISCRMSRVTSRCVAEPGHLTTKSLAREPIYVSMSLMTKRSLASTGKQ
jgi:hypothetical protein